MVNSDSLRKDITQETHRVSGSGPETAGIFGEIRLDWDKNLSEWTYEDIETDETERDARTQETVEDITLVCDAETGEIAEASTNIQELYGYSREEVVGMEIGDLSAKPSPFTTDSLLAEAEGTRGEGVEIMEWLCEDKEDRSFWAELSLKIDVEKREIEEKGEERLFCTVRELTQRKEIERELRERKSKIKDLHRATTRLDWCETEEELYQVAVSLAELILDFKVCSINSVEGNYLVNKAQSSQNPSDSYARMPLDGESIAAKTNRQNKSFLIEDLHESDEADPARESYRSLISIPIGGIGVFQAASNEVEYFDQEDLELAEMLMSHVNSKVNRIRTENELREQKEKIKELHRFASKIEGCEDEDEIYDRAIEAAEKILEFDLCVIGVEEDGYLVTGAATISEENIQEAPVEESGIGGISYLEKKDFLVEDIWDHPKTDPQSKEFTSAISVPIGDIGVMQVIDKKKGAFDENDLEMVKLLTTHVNEVVKRIRSRKELRERKRELSTLIKNLPGMVYRSESYSEAEFVSEASRHLINKEPEEITEGDSSHRDLIHPEDTDLVEKKVRAALDDRRPFEVSYRIVTEDGEQKWFQEWGSGLYSEDGLEGIEGFITDISDTKQREQLEVLNRVLRHNIRNEINVILGISDIVQEKTEKEVTQNVDDIKESSRRISKLSKKAGKVQKILDLNKHPRMPVDIVRVIREKVRLINQKNDGTEITTDLPEEAMVYSSGLLSSAVEEILENAIEHKKGKTEIEIWIEEKQESQGMEDKEWMEVKFSDNAPRIPENEREVIFKRKETSLQHGSGLGLWIINWIVDQCGGNLRFEEGRTDEEKENEGNTVVLQLPKA